MRWKLCMIPALIMWVVMMILNTGCWSRTELNELAVVLAIGIDTIDNQYEVTVQMVDPSQMTKTRVSDRSTVTTFSERSSTLFEAVRQVTTKASRKMYFAHMKLLIFDEKTAKKGIKESLDLLFRNYEIRPDFYLAVVRNKKAKDVMNLVTPTEVLPAMDMYKSLKVSEKFWAPTAAVNVKDILQFLERDGIEPVLTGMKLIGDIKKGKTSENVKNPISFANYKFTGIGVFRDDRLLGWLNESDSKAYTYIMNKITSTVGAVKCPSTKGKFVSQVNNSKIKIIPRIVNGKPSVRLNVFVEANIAEIHCKVDLTNEKSLIAIQKAASNDLEKFLRNGVKQVQREYAADIFGFGEAFHRKYPQQWHQWKDDWDVRFKKLPIEIKMNYNLRNLGKIMSPFDNNPNK
jgi:spore germination protein KC